MKTYFKNRKTKGYSSLGKALKALCCFLFTFIVIFCTATPQNLGTTRSIDLTGTWNSQKVLNNPHKGWYHHYYDNGWGYKTQTDSDLDSFPGMNHLYI